MRSGILTAGAVAVVSLAACSSSGSGTSSGATPATTPAGGGTTASSQAFCTELRTAQHKLSGIAGSMGNPMNSGNKLDAMVNELQQLKADAPAQLQAQFGDLASGIQSLKDASHGGNLKAIAKHLQQIGPKLKQDGQQIQQYLTKNC